MAEPGTDDRLSTWDIVATSERAEGTVAVSSSILPEDLMLEGGTELRHVAMGVEEERDNASCVVCVCLVHKCGNLFGARPVQQSTLNEKISLYVVVVNSDTC